jgi:hypothetical protein
VNFVYVMDERIEDGVQYTASILSPIVVGGVFMCICGVCEVGRVYDVDVVAYDAFCVL